MWKIYIYINKYNEDDFRILIWIKQLNSMDKQKHGNKEELSIIKASLIISKLETRKMFVNN